MTSTAPSRVIPALLEALVGDPPAGALQVLLHAFAKRAHLTAAAIRPGWIPNPILEALEAGDSVHVHLAALDDGHLPLRQLAVAAVQYTIGRADDEHGDPRMDDAAVAAAHDRLQASPVPPTSVLMGSTPLAGAGWRVTALWRLADPIDLRTPDGLTEARALLTDLAAALHADPPPADLASWTLELPGSRLRELPARADYAACLAVGDLAARHTPAALRAAILQETA